MVVDCAGEDNFKIDPSGGDDMTQSEYWSTWSSQTNSLHKAFLPESDDEKEAIDTIYAKALGNVILSGICNKAGTMLAHYLSPDPKVACTTVKLDMTEFLTQAGIAHAWMKRDVNYAMGAAERLVTVDNSSAYIVTKQEFGRTVSAEQADMSQILTSLGKDVFDNYFSMDWWFAIGAYRTWISAQVLFDGNKYTMRLQYNMRDYYDFECGSELPAGLTLDWQMNILHQAGMACAYDVIGAIVFNVEWLRGARYGDEAFTITPELVPTQGVDTCEKYYLAMQAGQVATKPVIDALAFFVGLASRR